MHLLFLIFPFFLEVTPNDAYSVLIDGYTTEGTLVSGDTVQLGTSIILVCRVSGASYDVETNFNWTCSTGECNVGNGVTPSSRAVGNVMMINVIFRCSGGCHYTCTVTTTSGARNSDTFRIVYMAGKALSSHGNFILPNSIITSVQDLQLNCTTTVIGGRDPMFYYRNGSDEQLIMNTAHGYQFSLFDETEIAALVINATSQLWNNQFSCKAGVNRPRNSDRRDIAFYLFLTSITDPLVSPVITSVTINNSNRLNVNLEAYEFPENIALNTLAKFIVSYERFDLKVPVMVRYQRYAANGTAETEGPLSVAGAKYRIKAWVIYDKQISPIPSELEYYVPERAPSSVRQFIITNVFKDGMELNWLPPSEPNGDVHYVIQYWSDTLLASVNTACNQTHYNITGISSDGLFHIRVITVNGAGSTPSKFINYTHVPGTNESTETKCSFTRHHEIIQNETESTETNSKCSITAMPQNETDTYSATHQNGRQQSLITAVLVTAFLSIILTAFITTVLYIVIYHFCCSKKFRIKTSNSHARQPADQSDLALGDITDMKTKSDHNYEAINIADLQSNDYQQIQIST